MKKPVVFTVLFFVLSAFGFAEFKLSEITANMGKGAFTSGFDVTLKFDSKKNAIEVTGNHERAYGVYFFKLPLNIKAGICGGVFKNQPQCGPYIIISPVGFLDIFYWKGWGFGKPNEPRLEFNNFFEAVGATVTLGNLKLSCIYNIFMGEKTMLPGVCYGININSDFKFFLGCDYKAVSKDILFRIGVTRSWI